MIACGDYFAQFLLLKRASSTKKVTLKSLYELLSS